MHTDPAVTVKLAISRLRSGHRQIMQSTRHLLFVGLFITACAAPETADLDPATSALSAGGGSADQPLVPIQAPHLAIDITGGAPGEVRVSDQDNANTTIATCTSSCLVTVQAGHHVEIVASTPAIDGGLSGACTSAGPSCLLTVGNGISVVIATFTPAPHEP